MLRRFWLTAQSYIICAETGCFRCLSRSIFRCWYNWGRTFLLRFWRNRRRCRCLCRLLYVRTPSQFLRLRCRCATRYSVWSGSHVFHALPWWGRCLAWRRRLLRLRALRGFCIARPMGKAVRELDNFMDEFTGSRFYLLGRGMLCAVRVVGLLCAVVQLFYKFPHHLALDSRCALMFWLLVFWTAVSFSNVWNIDHLLKCVSQ